MPNTVWFKPNLQLSDSVRSKCCPNTVRSWPTPSLDPAEGFTETTVAPISYTNALLSVVISCIPSIANSTSTLPLTSAEGTAHETIDEEI